MGSMIFELAHPDDRQLLVEAHQQVLAEPGARTALECRFRHKDGSWRVLETIARSSLSSRGEFHIIVNARDVTERKRAEEELREHEELARALLNVPTDTALLIDTEGTVIVMNERGATSMGTTPEEIAGTCIYDHFPPEVSRKRREQCTKAINSRKVVRLDDKRDGTFFDTTIYPVIEHPGNGQLAIVAHDMTDRMKAEEELREREHQLRMITDNMEDIIAYLDSEGVYRYVSPSFGRVLGYDVEEHLGASALELPAPRPVPTTSMTTSLRSSAAWNPSSPSVYRTVLSTTTGATSGWSLLASRCSTRTMPLRAWSSRAATLRRASWRKKR